MKLFKNICIQLHKWLGLIMSLMFLIWFLSGIVLIFVGFPHASKQERFEFLKPFSTQDWVGLKSPSKSFKGKIVLEKWGNKPVYRVLSGKKSQTIYDARTLKQLPEFSCKQAELISVGYLKSSVSKIEKIDELDSWMPWSYYEPLLPIYKCSVDDDKHSRLYVSSVSGTIVQHTTRKSRWLGRIGAIPHWIYFKQLRLNVTRWKNIVLVISILGLLVCLSGIILGFIRLKRDENNRIIALTPYKKWSYKWHHILGFAFGIFVLTFVLSGLFSVSGIPQWMVAKGSNPTKLWDKTIAVNKNINPTQIRKSVEDKSNVRRIIWSSSMGQPVWEVYRDDHRMAETYQIKDGKISLYTLLDITTAKNYAKQIFSDQDLSIEIIKEYTNYYKTSGMFYRPLPVYKITLDNRFNHCLFINPLSGKAISAIDNNGRARRWLYRALHTFNFPVLENYPVLRKLLLILVSIIGVVISYTGGYIGIKKIKANKNKSNNL